MIFEDAEQVTTALDVAEQVAAVRVLGHHAQRLALAAAADHDRDVPAQRLGIVERAVHPEVVAMEGRPLLGEHRARDLNGFLEKLEALAERRELEAVGACFTLEPGGADPVPGATTGDDVERRRDLRVNAGFR